MVPPYPYSIAEEAGNSTPTIPLIPTQVQQEQGFRISLGLCRVCRPCSFGWQAWLQQEYEVNSRALIQMGVNVTVPGKKKPLCQSTGLAAGARPVYKMYARPSCAKHKIKISFLLLTTNSITLDNKKIWKQVWAIALIAVSPQDFL